MFLDKNVVIFIFILMTRICFASAQDSISHENLALRDNSVATKIDTKPYRLNYKCLIAPAAFIGYGVMSLKNVGVKQINYTVRKELVEHHPTHILLDNYTQYAPAALVYGLNAVGIKGKHNYRDITIIYATSQLIAAAFVVPLKHSVKEERPDGANKQSFPSGHTATAFSSAQFMFREYKDTNIWLGVSGYSFAVFTGVYRVINDRHWVGDVIAGAGFGIVSTELAYWLSPKITRLFVGKETKATTMITPIYRDKCFGVGWVKTF